MKIEKPQIEASYVVAKQVYEASLTKEAGARQLHDRHGMHLESARDYIRVFLSMMNGSVFKRTTNAAAADHYFSKILNDFGAPRLRLALSSVRQHIEYYEGLRKGNLPKLRAVVSHYSSLADGFDFATYESEFRDAVRKSLADSSERRTTRLKTAQRKPVKVTVTTFYFQRNPDVVAEVLFRAKGSCQSCHKKAPFVRKSDGTPYLEVHHKLQLADGGEDVVGNAIALCPNCHRRAHFGPELDFP